MKKQKIKGSSIRKASLTSKKLTEIIAKLSSDKKADDIIALDMRKVANFCDFFVICSGNTDRQVKAIAEHIEEGLTNIGIKTKFKRGTKSSAFDWVVLDAGDVVTHIFQKETREFYQLEYLWREANKTTFGVKE